MIFRISSVLTILSASVSSFFDNIHIVNVFNYDFESDVFFEILHPKELGFTFRIRPATTFGVPLNGSVEPFNSKLIPTVPALCCDVPQNPQYLYGNIALVERGECTFKQKALNAEAVGAKGIIISDDDQSSDIYIDMLDDETTQKTKISAAFLLGQNGYMIRKILQELNREYAEIKIPLNITKHDLYNKKQPPWMIW